MKTNNEPQVPTVNVPVSVILQVLKYCEDNQIYDKLGSYQNFYYKLNQLRREHDENKSENVNQPDDKSWFAVSDCLDVKDMLFSRSEMLEIARTKINSHFLTNYKTHNDIMSDKQTGSAMIGFMKCWGWLDQLYKEHLNDTSESINKSDAKSVLQLAGKLALASRLVTLANAKNLSIRIEDMEQTLDAYDNAIISLSNKPNKVDLKNLEKRLDEAIKNPDKEIINIGY